MAAKKKKLPLHWVASTPRRIHAHNEGMLADQHNEVLQPGSEIKSGTISHKKNM